MAMTVLSEVTIRNRMERRFKIDELLSLFVSNLRDKKFDEAFSVRENLDAAIKNNNKESKKEELAAMRAMDDSMYQLVLSLRYPKLKVVETKNNETGEVTYSIGHGADFIDPIELETFCKDVKSPMAHPGWKHTIEKFAYLMAVRTGTEIGDGAVAQRFNISEIGMEVKLTKADVSNTKLVKTLQMIVDQMIFIERPDGQNAIRVTSHDLKWLLNALTKVGHDTNALSFSKVKTIRILILRMINTIVTGKSCYLLDGYDMKKESTKAGNCAIVNDAKEETDDEQESDEVKKEEEKAE